MRRLIEPNYTKDDSADSKKYFLKCYLAMIIASLISNGIVVASIPWLSLFFVAPEHRIMMVYLTNKVTFMFLAQILPFLVVTPLIAKDFLPGFHSDFVRRISESVEMQRNALQLPIRTTFWAVLGWVVGTFTSSGYFIFLEKMPVDFMLNQILFVWILAGIALFLSFYSLEFINRRFVLSKLGFTFGSEAMQGVFNLNLRLRLVIHLIATVILPTAILARIISFLEAHKSATFDYLSKFDFIVLLFAIIFIGGMLTWLQSRFISEPLREMQLATSKIQSGAFDASVSVTSGDEIGILAADINAMARGLGEREKMRELFGRIVDPSVRDYLLQEQSIKGELKHVTVMFCDLAGFTSYSENHSPEAVVHFLNRYFALANNIVTSNGGIINKFIGDAFMAIFNAPIPLLDHASKAIDAGIAFRTAYQKLKIDGKNKPGIRIGIHTGEVLAGRIGSEERQEYTVIGDAVNVASRVEALGKKVGENLLVTAATVSLAGDYQFRKIGNITLRGKTNRTLVFAI